MTRLYSPRYVLAVLDLARSADYYQHVLGFEIREIGDPGWRLAEKGDIILMLGHCPEAIPPARLGDHSYFAYILVEGLDAYHDQVKANGAQILSPPADKPWGMREFALRTVDGHRIMFGIPLP